MFFTLPTKSRSGSEPNKVVNVEIWSPLAMPPEADQLDGFPNYRAESSEDKTS
jgi:hypothetical protein